MGLLGVALGAGEGLVTQLRGSTKRFNKMLRSALPASVWPSLPQLLSPVPTWARGTPSAAPWSCCPRRPFSMLLLSSQPPAPHTRPFPRILREPELVPGTPGSGSSQPLSWGRSLPRYPQDQPGPLPPSGGAASRSPWGGAAAGGRFSASGPAGEGVACGAGGLARGPGSRRTVLFAVRRAPGLMAAPGTRGAGVAFAAQKEVVLERPCWLDGGCEQARRGYLYGQLCCVGGCGWRGGGAGGRTRLRERPGRPRGPGGGAWPRRSPAPRLGAETPGEEGGVESPLPPRSLRRRGWGVGRAGRPGLRVPGSRLSAVCPREV